MQDAGGTVRFPSRDEVVTFVEASRTLFATGAEIPSLEGEFVVTAHPVVFVTHTA